MRTQRHQGRRPRAAKRSSAATVLTFPPAIDFQQHMQALQLLAQVQPKAAKAIVTFTERAACRVRQRKTGS